MSLFVPRRRPTRELLDDENLPFEEMIRSLADIDRVNRQWGAAHALERYLLSRIQGSPGEDLLLLDVGAGSGVMTSRLGRTLSHNGVRVHPVALDVQWRHLRAGRDGGQGPRAVAADAFLLPFASGTVDWVVSTLVFHHFSPEQNVELLREFARVARRGFALLDLRRHLFPLLFVSIAGPFLFESQVSVVDGPASVRQAYTREEALEIARRALPGASVKKVFPFRLLITAPGIQDSRLKIED